MRVPREWAFFGRPVGEWLYLVLLCAVAANGIHGALTSPYHGLAQASVQAGNFVIGVSTLGVVVATIAGRHVGLRLLWLFALSLAYVGTMATWSYGAAPLPDVLVALLSVAIMGGVVIWYGSRRLHASITRRLWPELVADHAKAADEFVAAISGMTDAEWTSRTTPDSWSAAEITDHLARTYSQYAGESRGKDSLRKRLGPVRRTLVNLLVKPRLLASGVFPKAKAPRSLRPGGGPPTPADGIALFRATGESCLRDLEIMAQRRPHRGLVHPLFGTLPLHEAVRFATHHIRHHRRQLPAASLSAEKSNDIAS
jgi:hypothetical protein